MTENRVQITDAVGASLVGAQTVESGKMKVALATSTTPAATGRRSRGMVTPCGLRLDGVVKVQSGKLIEIFRFAQNDIFAVWARSLQRGRCRCCRSLRLASFIFVSLFPSFIGHLWHKNVYFAQK